MKTQMAFALIVISTWAPAQEQPTLEDLEAERLELQQRLDENRSRIEGLEGGDSHAPKESNRKDWEVELKKEFDTINQYLVELPEDLSTYFVTMQGALGDLLTELDESWNEPGGSSETDIAEAERSYERAREKAMSENRLQEMRARAQQLNATPQATAAIDALQNAYTAVEAARAAADAAAKDLARREQEAQIAARKAEMLLLDIETRQLEQSLANPQPQATPDR